MVTLSEVELDTVASPTASIHLTFFGISIGALIAFIVVLSTVDVQNPKTYATFVGLTALSALAASYFGIRAAVDFNAVRTRVKEIKAGRF